MSLRDEWGSFQSFVHDRHPALHRDGFAGNSTLFAEWLAVRLAAERAATIEEVRTSVSDLMARTVGRDYKIYSPGLKDALSLLRTLARDRSALHDALAQARREQREKDARIVETAAGCNCAAVDIGVGTLHEPTCGLVRPDDAAAAIRAPAAPMRQRGEQED